METTINLHPERELTAEETEKILEIRSEDITITLLKDLFARTLEHEPKYHVNDYFKLPTSRFNTKKEVYTTIGIYIVNLHLIQPHFSSLFGYINKPFNGDELEDFEDKLSYAVYTDKVPTEHMADYYNRIQWLGGNTEMSFLSPSITPALMKPPREVLQKKEELFKKYGKELTPDNPNNAVIGAKIEKELVKDAQEYLSKQDGAENIESKSKVNVKNHYKNMNIMKGPLKNSYTGKYIVTKSNYNSGVSKEEYSSFADSAVLGAYCRAVNTQKGGYLCKKSNQAMNAVMAGPKGSDCKTTKTLDVFLFPKQKSMYMNRYILDNGLITELTDDNFEKYSNTTVHMRSPMYCIYKQPCYCNICLGEQPYFMNLPNFGLAISSISNKILLLSMKKFHDMTVKTTKVDTEALFDFTD